MKKASFYLPDVEVAVRYNISRSTVWRWVKEGKFPKPVKLGEAATRWRICDLQAWEVSRCPLAPSANDSDLE